MSNKLIIILSGKKQAGKNTACNYILSKYFNKKIVGSDKWMIDPITGGLIWNSSTGPKPHIFPLAGWAGAKVYSFADPLKRFCIDVFGVPEEGCYGSDEQKNATISHLLWENLPLEFRPLIKLSEKMDGNTEYKTGPMTSRELMQIVGTDFARRIYGDCWARGTYNSIKREGFELALVCDGRFPNEIKLGHEVGAKSIRLSRNVFHDKHKSETALDGYESDFYSLYIDNQNMTIEEQCAAVSPVVDRWFEEAGI